MVSNTQSRKAKRQGDTTKLKNQGASDSQPWGTSGIWFAHRGINHCFFPSGLQDSWGARCMALSCQLVEVQPEKLRCQMCSLIFWVLKEALSDLIPSPSLYTELGQTFAFYFKSHSLRISRNICVPIPTTLSELGPRATGVCFLNTTSLSCGLRNSQMQSPIHPEN